MSNIREMYTFVESKDKKWQGIGLTEKAGKYQGIVYRYGEVSFGEENKNGEMPLQFQWEMLDSNGLPKNIIEDDFFKLIGDILQDLLMEQVEQDNLEYVDTDDREDNPQQSSL